MKILPFRGQVRLSSDSGLRKLMRAARRNLVPSEQLGIIQRATESAEKRRDKYLSSHARHMSGFLSLQ